MRRVAYGLLVLTALLGGCDTTKSNLEPSEPLAALDAVEATQLCRYTTDVLTDADLACDPAAPAGLTDFDACVAARPWDACPAPAEEPADVGSWEACVNARLGEACGADAEARCWHLRCL